jgi:hypothetical protein
MKCTALLTVYGVAVLICVTSLGGTPPSDDWPLALDDLVGKFNAASDTVAAGAEEPRVTVAEMIAAIRAALLQRDTLSPIEARHLFQRVVEARQAPRNAKLEVVTLSDPGGEYVFDVHDIYLRLPTADGGEIGIAIRKRFIASRTLDEEIRRLETELKAAPVLPGRYRLEDRVRQLKDRQTATAGGRDGSKKK